MIGILQNRPEYQIQIDQKCPYPFNGPKPQQYKATVKLQLPISQQNLNQCQNLQKYLTISSPLLIQILKITQSHINKCYTIIYEYIPYSLTNNTIEQIEEYIKEGKYKKQLQKLFKSLVEIGIKPIITYECFGFNQKYQMKVFIKPVFQELQTWERDDLGRAVDILMCDCDKIFDNVSSGIKFKNKVSHLSQKIKKIQTEILTKQFRRRQKKSSQSGINSSQNSDSNAKTNQNEKIGNAQWRFDHDFHFEDSLSVQQSKSRRKKRSSSFKDGQKPKSEVKQKKASWQASYKEEKLSNGESDKITVLKKRISEALFKTQKTLTKYEKIRSRTDKKRNHRFQ